ncbi:hypothetical protein AU106_gp217 [Sinorhizobium phage phiM9]|uniref:Uncharacterized protein n=1 Tax=Sinorhizobium phage phiM9 TaxID=1636182 RepID=A0A0F6R7Q5_9CAUD|nr:hypothetical protein AU106_gp217 [Sinorhizobium phage phiM9]AKE44848.1 hypothetical protein Sm_phiM9_221 [Sinorhizobium phage phiM9]
MKKFLMMSFGFILVTYGYNYGMTTVSTYGSKATCLSVANKIINADNVMHAMCIPDDWSENMGHDDVKED